MFVTSDGSPYARFRRALQTGNEALVVAAALELPQIALDDAAVRWLGRFALEVRGVTIEDIRLAADALDALPERTSDAMERLQRLCLARGVA